MLEKRTSDSKSKGRNTLYRIQPSDAVDTACKANGSIYSAYKLRIKRLAIADVTVSEQVDTENTLL